MEVRIRYLGHEIAKRFGSSGKVETIHVSGSAKYEDILSILGEKLRRHGKLDERLMDTFVFICEGRTLLSIKEDPLNTDCEVMVGYADTGG